MIGPEWCPEPHWKVQRSLPVVGVVGGEVPLGVAGEDEPAAGRQHAGDHRRARGHLPLDLARRHVDRLERAGGLVVDQGQRAAPVGLPLDEERLARGELGAVVDHRHDTPGRWPRRRPSGSIPCRRPAPGQTRTPASVGSAAGLTNGRPVFGIEAVDPLGAVGPGDLAERLAVEELAVLAVQAVEVAVAVRLDQRLDPLAVAVDVDQHGLVDAVVVPDVVGAVLEVPLVCAVVRVECQDRAGVEVVALADLAVEVGRGVADAPVQGVELGVVGAGDPGRAAAGEPGVALPGRQGLAGVVRLVVGGGDGVEPPEPLAGLERRRRR